MSEDAQIQPFAGTNKSLIGKDTRAALAMLKQSSQAGFTSIRLAQGQSPPALKGLISQGRFFISAPEPNECIPLGKKILHNGEPKFELECVVGPWRPHALKLRNNQVEAESFVFDDPIFQQIVRGKDIKDVLAHLYGTDVLFYIPPHSVDYDTLRGYNPELAESHAAQYANGFTATYFFNKTAKSCSPADTIPAGTAIVLRSTIIETAKFSWWSPNETNKLDPSPDWASPEVVNSIFAAAVPGFLAPEGDAEVLDADEGNDTPRRII